MLLALAMVMSQYVLAADSYETVGLDDNSDWWSLSNPHCPLNFSPVAKMAKKRKISKANMQILGITLEIADNPPTFERAIQKLGRAVVVSDAHFSRQQVCYVSNNSKNKVYLVFEEAETSAS